MKTIRLKDRLPHRVYWTGTDYYFHPRFETDFPNKYEAKCFAIGLPEGSKPIVRVIK